MTGKLTRKTTRSILAAKNVDRKDGQAKTGTRADPDVADKASSGVRHDGQRVDLTVDLTQASANRVTEANGPSQEEVRELTGASSSYEPPTGRRKKEATRFVHSGWSRICHPVPKCDSCGKKCGHVGPLHRCGQCPFQICKSCVEGGSLEPDEGSSHPARHVMNVEELDWSPATKEEKAAFTKRGKAKKKKHDAVEKTSVTGNGKAVAKGTAIRGVGLCRKPASRPSEEFLEDKSASNLETFPNFAREPFHAITPDTAHPRTTRKRGLNSAEDAIAQLRPEKAPRTSGPPRTPANSLAPIRSVMEPQVALRLPSVSHLGYHSLQYDLHGPHNAAPATRYNVTDEARQVQPTIHVPLQHGSQPLSGRAASTYPVKTYSVSGTTVHSSCASSLGSYTGSKPACAQDHARARCREAYDAPLTGYPPAVRAPTNNVSGLLYKQHSTYVPPPSSVSCPSIQDLSTDLYHDILQTHKEYKWALSICLLHEVSRSWSRGALHRVAETTGGPGAAGFDTLFAVADRVSEWLGLKNDWDLHEWLRMERRAVLKGRES